MKGKLSFMWRATLALVLALSLGVVMAVPVSAAVSQPTVTLNKYAPLASDAVYTITFTTNEELVTGDTITIEFPATGGTDITAITPAVDDDVTVGGANQASVIVGQRLSITLGNDLPIGDITVVVGGTATKVTNPADGDYTLDVYTREEPTAVTSAEYMISKELAQPTVANPAPQTVGTAATYTIGFDTTVELRNNDIIVIEFPVDTDISNVDVADVTVTDSGSSDVTVGSIAIAGQVLTITLGGTLATGASTTVAIDNIINPTTVDNPDPDTNNWTLTVYTAFSTGTGGERIPAESDTYVLTPKTAISQIAWSVVDEYVPNDTDADQVGSTEFVIETQDQYGNPVAVTADTTFTLTASTGDFYSEAACTTVITSIQIDINKSDSGASANALFYKGAYNAATDGTVTITADELVSQGWTIASTTILVNPELELWGGGERKAYYNTFTDAIAAALPDDTIKVAPSTYDGGFNVDKPYLTIESTAGKATTIIEGSITLNAGATNFVLGGSSGKGFTLQEGTPQYLVNLGTGPDNVTLSYNTFIQSREGSHAILVTTSTTGLTVTQNDFTLPYKWGHGVFFSSTPDGIAIGLTVTHNTFTGGGSTVDNSAMELHTVDISSGNDTIISNNEFTALQNGILIGTDQAGTGLINTTGTGALEISGNTFDGLMYAIDLVEAAADSQDHNVVITNNTFTSNTIALGVNKGAYPEAADKWNPEDFIVDYNDFSGNTYGVFNDADDGTALIVDDNWWGDVTGPADAVNNPDGTGDAIGIGENGTVTCDSWLNAAGGTPIKSQPITLYAGWNLISLPLIPVDSDIDTVLAGAGTGVTVNKVAYFTGGPAGDWLSWFPSPPIDLYTMNDGKGYWIDASAGTLTATGFELALHGQAPPTYNLVAGWNLIGVTSIGTPLVENYLGSVIDTVEAMYLYDASSGAYTAVVSGDPLVTGAGYWLAVNAAGTIYP